VVSLVLAAKALDVDSAKTQLTRIVTINFIFILKNSDYSKNRFDERMAMIIPNPIISVTIDVPP